MKVALLILGLLALAGFTYGASLLVGTAFGTTVQWCFTPLWLVLGWFYGTWASRKAFAA